MSNHRITDLFTSREQAVLDAANAIAELSEDALIEKLRGMSVDEIEADERVCAEAEDILCAGVGRLRAERARRERRGRLA